MPGFTSMAVISVVVMLALLGLIISRLYTRTSQERAFVRTGLGGQKVVMTGGALVLPIFHEIIWVNRGTQRLEVRRDNEHSLITQDRMRVDVSAEFYVRTGQSAEALVTAAQTLGVRTNDPVALKSLVEGKFVDALRSAAACMTMEQLHEHRADFVKNVKTAVTEDLSKNGLELEAVSLTGLNQTRREFFVDDNAFDAEGLLKLTREIEQRRKARNDVEQDTKVAIAQKDLAATEQQLALTRTREEVTLRTNREIAEMTAQQAAATAAAEADNRRKAEEANLRANQAIAESRIDTERAVAEAEATKLRAIETAQISAQTDVDVAAQQQAIVIAEKSRETAAAEAAASLAQAEAVKAAEAVETTRQVAVANRQKDVALVNAEEKARQESIGVVVAAEAQAAAAESQAAAVQRLATGERDAAMLRAEAITAEGQARADALRANNEAQNLLSPALIVQQVRLELLRNLPGIIEKSVAPLLNIDSIRIAEVGGLTGGSGGGAAGGSGPGGRAPGGLGEEVVNSALRYRTAQPVVDALLAEVGLKQGAGSMSGLMQGAMELANAPMEVDAPAVAEVVTEAAVVEPKA